MSDTFDGPLLVLADSYQLACHYAREHDLGRPGARWRYIGEAHSVLGLSGPGRYVVVTIPGVRHSALDLADRLDALRYLRSHGFVSAS